MQVASVGLLNAIDRFDVERDVQFSTCAAVTIIGEPSATSATRWAIRVPRRLQEIGLRVNTVLPVLSQGAGRFSTVEEIAVRCEASPEEILDAMEAVQAYSTTSLDSPVGEEGAVLIEVLGGEDPSLEILSRAGRRSRPRSRSCRERERRVLYLRFFRGLTQSEIASEVGVSQMHVSRGSSSQTLAFLQARGPRRWRSAPRWNCGADLDDA